MTIPKGYQTGTVAKWTASSGGEFVPSVYNADGNLIQVAWAPQRGSQAFFLRDPTIEVLYEGTRGPGKTDALIMDFCQEVGKGWGAEWKGVLFRQTHPQLRDVIEKSKKWVKRIWPSAFYNEVKTMWEWKSGERLYFSHFDNPSQYANYHGHAYPWIGWEELTTWASPDCYKVMFSCSRSTIKGMPRKIRATTNPYGCVRDGEVLTENGWVNIKDFTGQRVVSVGAGGQLRLSDATLHTQLYDGTLAQRKGRGVFMEFTTDHRLPLLNTAGTSHLLRTYTDLPSAEARIRATGTGWIGTDFIFDLPAVKSRKLKRAQPTRLKALQFATLMGWYLSEGCTVERDRGFSISQQKHRQLLAQDMADLGFIGSWSGQQFNVCNPSWFAYLDQFGKCRDKFIPRVLLDAPREVLQCLLDRLMIGDGCQRCVNSGSYYTISKQLADDVAEVCVKLGLRVYVSERQRNEREGLSYAVSFSPSKPIWLRDDLMTETEFSGEVYCLRVPGDETFFIRQNGCVWLSGNCGHNWVKTRWRLPLSATNDLTRIVGPLIEDSVDEKGHKEPPRRAIHGFLDENKLLLHADPGYKDRIKAAARNASELAAWMDGSWDIVAGGMFDDIWYEYRNTIILEPFNVPPDWKIYRAYDHGSSKPFSVGWYAVSDGSDLLLKDGSVRATVRGDYFRIHEWYGWRGQPNEGSRMLIADISRGIIEREIRWGLRASDGSWTKVSRGPADSAIFDETNGVCIATDFEKPVYIGSVKHRGVFWEKADKGPGSRKQGWEQIRKRLKATQRPEGGFRELPGLFISSECTHWLRCVPVLPRGETDIDDVDDESEDHNGDETRYMMRFEASTMRSGRVAA